MSWIVARIKWIMLVSGALTCTMLYAAIAIASCIALDVRTHPRRSSRGNRCSQLGRAHYTCGGDADLWSLPAGEQAIDCKRGRIEQTGLHWLSDSSG